MPRTTAAKGDAELLYQRVGEAIRQARGPLTQTELADLIGTEQTTLSDYEKAKSRAPLHVIVAIETARGLPLGYILRQADLVSDDVEDILAADPALSTDEDRRAVASFYRFTRDEYHQR